MTESGLESMSADTAAFVPTVAQVQLSKEVSGLCALWP